MAEVMPKTYTDFKAEEAETSEDGRPPKLLPHEAAYLLERGPYIARLHAQERLLEVVMAFTVDRTIRPFMDARQPELIKQEIVRLQDELTQFEAIFTVITATVKNRDKEEQASCGEIDSEQFSLEKGEPNNLANTDTDEQAPSDKEADIPTRVVIGENFLRKREIAVCSQTDPELFFPEKGGSTKEAKRICVNSCDLTDECLQYALENKERFGIWGGMSERERRKLGRKTVVSA